MNYSTYDVAVMNYPLFDKREETDNIRKRIFIDKPIELGFDVPIYIHIPFCDSLCDFCVHTRKMTPQDKALVNEYVDALISEIEMYAAEEYVQKQRIKAVFIGGGTPTALSESQLCKILTVLRSCFDINNSCEITVECSTQNAHMPKLHLLKDFGVSRISTGVQTFNDTLRSKLHIKSESKSVMDWIEKAKEIQFTDVSIDLIYGFPNTNVQNLLYDFHQALQLGLNQISVYKLSLFVYTNLYKDIVNGRSGHVPSEDILYEMFLKSHAFLINHGYYLQSTQEYSIKERTVKFWDLTYDGYGDNLSFGASSFGYLNGFSYQNESRISQYIDKIKNKKMPVEKISKRITWQQRMERAMAIGFRKGVVSKKSFDSCFDQKISDIFQSQIGKQIKNHLMYESNDGYYLTEKGLYHQGEVSADYMVSLFENVSPWKKNILKDGF